MLMYVTTFFPVFCLKRRRAFSFIEYVGLMEQCNRLFCTLIYDGLHDLLPDEHTLYSEIAYACFSYFDCNFTCKYTRG